MHEHRPGHDRLTLRAEFAWWWEPNDEEAFARLEEGDEEVVAEAVNALIGDRLEGLPEHEAAYTGMGRGADGPAIAVAFIAIAAAVGHVNDWFDTAERIGRLWKAIRRRGRPPKLSLGAVTMLCICDLHRRIGDVSDIQLIWTGDVAAGPQERGFSGEDLYGVLFARAGKLWVYIVDDLGQVIHFGDGMQNPHAALRFVVGSEEWIADAPALPDNLLLPDDQD